MNIIKSVIENKKLTKKQAKRINLKVQEPKTIGIEYYKELKKLANELKADVRNKLIPILNTVNINQTTDSVSDILNVVTELQNKYSNILAFSGPVARTVVNRINRYNKNSFSKKSESQLGVNLDLILNESNIQESLELEIRKQMTLIKSIPDEFLKNVEIVITNGYSNGLRWEEIARQLNGIKNISSTFGKLDNRVKMIARNEIGNINGNLNKLRQQNAGIAYYEWQTSEDESVRESHKILNGKICKWNDATVYADSIEDANNNKWKKRSSIGAVEKHPAMDYNCRCLGTAVIDID